MGVAVRISSGQLSNELIVFLRNAFGLLFLMPWVLQKGMHSLATRRLPAHLFRSVCGLAAMYCFFYAIAHLQLAEAVLLNYSSPLFIAIIAILWFGEEASWKLALAIITGFVGVCFILKPGAGLLQGAAIIGLLSALFAAFAMVTIRDLSRTEPTHRIVFYFSLVATLISAIPLLWIDQFPDIRILIWMAFAGLAATLGQLCLTFSYSLAPASRVGPYTYSTVIFAALYGWLFWAETPDYLTFTGAILVITACTISIKRRKLAR